MKLVGSIAITSGLLALVASALPLSQVDDYQLYVGIQHLGATLKLLYILPFAALVSGILVFTGKLAKPLPWLVVTGIAGLLLAGLASFSAIEHLEMMGSMFGASKVEQPSLATGAYTSLLAYALLFLAPFAPS